MDVIKLLDELGINTKTGDNFDNLNVVLQKISEKWVKIDQRHYLGDIKWVLYQYICDMDSDKVSIRCGNFALSKLVPSNTASFDTHGLPYYNININGEKIIVCHIPEMSKKQLIISAHNFDFYNGLINDTTVYPGDIVLYFA